MKIYKAFGLLLGFSILLAALAGCGRKGDLVLPDEAQKPQAQKPAATPGGQ